jgi:hypothetical protein
MTSERTKTEDIASDLLMALLAVNSWTLEKVGSLYPTMHANGLFDVSLLAKLEIEQIQERLAAAGFNRGPVLGAMMALRMHHVGLALAEGGAQLLARLEATGDSTGARGYLLSLKGVGPAVVDNYLLLRSSARS